MRGEVANLGRGGMMNAMNKNILYTIIVLIVLAVGFYWYGNQSGGTATPSATLNADVYPLYSGATWGQAEATTSPDYGQVVEVQSVPVTNTSDISAVSTPFTKYYDDKLTAAGWTPDVSREAGGPGAEISVYTKGDQFIVVMFSSLFHVMPADAPEQCPCDVTLSLMSGTQVGPTPAQVQATHVYNDSALGFSITLPTPVATAPSNSDYSVDPNYEYTEQGPGKSIPGVKFTIPTSEATGTNLASDSYVSVEHLPAGAACNAAAFLSDPNAKSQTAREGVLSYSVASSTDAAVGNRYEEWVYARQDSSPCIAVRYYIHYAAIENFPAGAVKEFDKAALLQEFDQIRRTLALGK